MDELGLDNRFDSTVVYRASLMCRRALDDPAGSASLACCVCVCTVGKLAVNQKRSCVCFRKR